MAPANVNVITNIYTRTSKHEQDEVTLVLSKKRCKLFKWRDKIQAQRFVAYFIVNRNSILCIHVKALGTDFQLPSKMGAYWAKM